MKTKPSNERELLRSLYWQTRELKQKAWHIKDNPEKCRQIRNKEQIVYEKYMLLKGIREVKNRRDKTR